MIIYFYDKNHYLFFQAWLLWHLELSSFFLYIDYIIILHRITPCIPVKESLLRYYLTNTYHFHFLKLFSIRNIISHNFSSRWFNWFLVKSQVFLLLFLFLPFSLFHRYLHFYNNTTKYVLHSIFMYLSFPLHEYIQEIVYISRRSVIIFSKAIYNRLARNIILYLLWSSAALDRPEIPWSELKHIVDDRNVMRGVLACTVIDFFGIFTTPSVLRSRFDQLII